MSTGRICPRCFTDIPLVCRCKMGGGVRAVSAAQRTFASNQNNSSGASSVVPEQRRKRDRSEEAPVQQKGSSLLSDSVNPVAATGTSQAVVKAYVRPSSAPDLGQVRPQAVLEKSFAAVLCHDCPFPSASSSSAAGAASQQERLAAMADQLKSIRQDLVVQNVRNAFAAAVFECHARLCILLQHIPEFVQCLQHVREFHSRGVFGSTYIAKDHSRRRCVSFPLLNPPLRNAGANDDDNDDTNRSGRIEFVVYRLAFAGLFSEHDDGLAQDIARLEQQEERLRNQERTKRPSRHDNVSIWDHPSVRVVQQAILCRTNSALYMGLLSQLAPGSQLHAAASTALLSAAPLLRHVLLMFVPKLRIEWLKSFAGSMEEFVPMSVAAKLLGMSESDAEAMLKPILGRFLLPSRSDQSQGFHMKHCRALLTAHIKQVTEQRTT